MKKTLGDFLREKRAETSQDHCVETHHQPVTTLTVSLWQGAEWILPWSRLEAIRLVPVSGNEKQLEITFSHCLVIATGENFAGIMPDLREFMVCQLRELPQAYRLSLSSYEAFIARLEVRCRN